MFVFRNCKQVLDKGEFRVSSSLVLTADSVKEWYMAEQWMVTLQFHVHREVV